MAKRNPYIDEVKRDMKIFDDDALTIKQLSEIRNEGDNAIRRWLEPKLIHGEWEQIWKKSKPHGSVMAYRPKK